MPLDFSDDAPPGRDAVAQELASLLPESQRDEGIELLRSILEQRLAGQSTHPRPGRLAETVYDRLAEAINEADDGALIHLQHEALSAEVEALLQDSVALAAARYGSEHESAAELGRAWAAHHPAWLDRDAAFYSAEADRLQDTRQGLLSRVAQQPSDISGSLRPELLRADLNLRSARSGRFETASGSLADFLRDADATFEYLDFE